MKRIPCRVFAPATVANVAVGYDILGFAIHGLGDEIIIKKGKQKGLRINSIYGNRKLSKDLDKNVAGFTANEVLKYLSLEDEPVEINLYKNMPIGTGLGSSASSSVAGAYAMNSYLNYPLSEKEVLHIATLGEKLADGSYHADNTAPCLMGGITLIRDNEVLDVVRLPSIPGIKAVVLYPHIKILTKDSRDILSNSVDLNDYIKQTGNLAAFVAALYKSDHDLLGRCLSDIIIEPQRAQQIPKFNEMKGAALKEGAYGFSISGAGPSMFALCPNSFIGENIIEKAKQIYKTAGIELTCYLSDINLDGAKRL